MRKLKHVKPVPRRRIKRSNIAETAGPEVIMMKPSGLRVYATNAREHSSKQICQIKSSVEAFRFMNPILIDKNNEVIAGHG